MNSLSIAKPRVLVVDDNRDWLEILVRILEKDADSRFEVETASTFEEAITRITENKYDVVIADVRLNESEPDDEDGLRLAQLIADVQGDSTQVIILTAYVTVRAIREAFKEIHVFDFIEKGKLNLEDFLKRVHEAAGVALEKRSRALFGYGSNTRVRFFEVAGYAAYKLGRPSTFIDGKIPLYPAGKYARTDLEYMLTPRTQNNPLSSYGPIYLRFMDGRPPSGNDFSVVCEVARWHYGGEKADLTHRVAIVVTEQRPEPGARYRLYEIRQREGLAITVLDSSTVEQVSLVRSPIEILQTEIDQATGQQNLYAISTPVSGDLSFFGRERVLQDIIDLLNIGQPVGIFGLRKMGKTSLVQRLQGQLGQQRPIAFVDTQSTVRQQGVRTLYSLIITSIVKYLQSLNPGVALPRLRLYPSAESSAEAMSASFMQDLHQIDAALGHPGKGARMLLVVDEIDRLLPYEDKPGYPGVTDFLGQLRAANQQANMLDFLVIGVDPAINRCERWQNQDNELYRGLREIWMPRMSLEDTRKMIESLGSQMGVQYEPGALRLLAQVGGGQPFVTRQMCSVAVEGRVGTGAILLTQQDAAAAIEEFVYRDTYLGELWRTRLSNVQRDILSQLAGASGPIPRGSLLPDSKRQDAINALASLEEYTIVSRTQQGYVIVWEVFRKWIRSVELGMEN